MPIRRASISSATLALLGIVCITGLIAIVFLLSRKDTELEQPLTVEVIEGPFEANVLEQGTIESSKNISIKCEIESSDWEGTPILEAMDEGTSVKPGDVVAKFDPAKVKEELQKQKIAVNDSEAKAAQALSELDAAKEEEEEYFSEDDGMLARDRTKMETEKIQAEKEREQAKEYVAFSRRLRARGYITESQFRQDKQAFDQFDSKVRLYEIELKLLTRTAKRKEIELKSKIAAAEVALDNAKKTFGLEQEKLASVEKQLENCTVVVPEGVSGKIVYPDRWDQNTGRQFVLEPGAKIREKQVVVLIPNPAFMQVKASVNESRVVAVKEGLPVTIRIDALKDQVLKGTVERVGQFAEDQGWRSDGVNEYPAVIKIDDPPETLRSGMNASIEILVESKPKAIQVPFLAVTQRNEKFYSLVKVGDRWEAREVEIGSQNDRMICIKSGLKPGETVALDPDSYEHLAKLPDRNQAPGSQTKSDKSTKTSGKVAGKAN